MRKPPLSRRTGSQDTALSFAQARLWFLDQMGAGSAYNLPFEIRLRGDLDGASFERALAEIIRRHDVLRTVFPVVAGQPVQHLVGELEIPLQRIDLTRHPPERRVAEALAIADREARQPFDLASGPMLRPILLELDRRDHVFLMTKHHIVWDLWSTGVFYSELRQLYAAFSAGGGSPLPELGVQYRDVSVWQREWLTGATLERKLSYWRRALSGCPSLDLPADRPRPALQTYETSLLPVELSRELSRELRELCRRNELTLAMLLVAAWQVILMRYSGQADVATGMLVANRTEVETEPLIGFFVNLLVLRTDLAGDPSFLDEVMPRLKGSVLSAYDHQELPFEKLVEELNPPRDTSRHPIVQALFTLQLTPGRALQLGELEITTLGAPDATPGGAPALARPETIRSPFDIELRFVDHGERLGGHLVYDPDLFEPSSIAGIGVRLVALLERIVATPRARLSQLSRPDASERRRLLAEHNRTAVDHPAEIAVRLFERNARAAPDRVAAQHRDETLSYGELERRANRLANHLVELGVGPEVVVGIAVERSLDLVVALVAVHKAGGAYLPLDPDHPAERWAHMIADAEPRVVLTRGGGLPGEVGCPIVDLAAAPDTGRSTDPPAIEPAPASLAYVIYTSGSTGLPKAVLVEHRQLTNFLLAMQGEPGLAADDVLLAVTSLSFDIAALELFLPLIAGAKVVIADRSTAEVPDRLAAQIERAGATVLQSTPTRWQMLVASGWRAPRALKALCGGEELPPSLARDLLADPHVELWNLYGPTETTIWSAIERVRTSDPPISIGHPIANTQLYVLDGELEPVPVGVPGELVIGGEGVARGYLNRPEKTAAHFLPDTLGRSPAARLYRTGDRVRRLHDGGIQFLGRIDQQIKLRGQRVEPGEVEATLRSLPGVAEAVVVLADLRGEPGLVAYVVPAAARAPEPAELRSALAESLPRQMVPAAFVSIPELPLTVNSKLDRTALPDPSLGDGGTGTREEPATGTERAVAAIWQELLPVETVGREQYFVDLGGHSLLAIRVLTEIEERLGAKLRPGELLFGTLAEVAAACDAQSRGAAPTSWLDRVRRRLGRSPRS